MASYYRDGKSYTVAYDGRLDGKPKGQRSYIYGLKSKKLAEQAAAKKTSEEQLLHSGLYRPEQNLQKILKAEAQPINELADTFERSILNRGKDAKYARTQAFEVKRLCRLAGIRTIPEIDAAAIQAAARRLMDEEGLSPRSANQAIKAMRQFATWMFATKRTRYDVLHKLLETYNEDKDKRRQRRAMSEDEIAWLLTVTAGARDFVSRRCGIAPADRAMLYATGLGTGYRQGALLTLTKASFHVGEKLLRPFVRLGAAANKKGRDRDQVIRRDLAAQLRKWLEDKPESGPVWTLSKGADLSLRFRRDMERARAEWIAAAPSDSEERKREASNFLRYVYHDGVRNVFADFHGLRHTGITLVVRSAGLRVGQAWADHSTPVLTANYSHLNLPDEDKALEALPPAIDPTNSDLARQPARTSEKAG